LGLWRTARTLSLSILGSLAFFPRFDYTLPRFLEALQLRVVLELAAALKRLLPVFLRFRGVSGSEGQRWRKQRQSQRDHEPIQITAHARSDATAVPSEAQRLQVGTAEERS